MGLTGHRAKGTAGPERSRRETEGLLHETSSTVGNGEGPVAQTINPHVNHQEF